MQLSVRTFRAAAMAVLLATGLVACGDDDNGTDGGGTPPAPTGLTATATSETSVDVSWTAVTGATTVIAPFASA